MNTISPGQVIGIDVSRDWLDIHCLPDGRRLRLPNAPDGHAQVASLARRRNVLVCFEATGGQEWRLWAVLDAAQIVTRRLPPAQGQSLCYEHHLQPAGCEVFSGAVAVSYQGVVYAELSADT